LSRKLASQVDDGTLRGTVTSFIYGRRRHQAQNGGDVDDAARTSFKHIFRNELGQKENAIQIQLHYTAEFEHWLVFRRSKKVRPCIVDEYIDLAEIGQGTGH
jgi:hypothetical protein